VHAMATARTPLPHDPMISQPPASGSGSSHHSGSESTRRSRTAAISAMANTTAALVAAISCNARANA
jgi:hypothetical protein